MFSIKRTALMLAGIGAIMVSVHGASVLMGFCAGDINCTASVYFGVPQTFEVPAVMLSQDMPLSSPTMIAGSSVGIQDVQAIVQVVGVYALLLGVSMILLLELVELKLLRKSLKKKRRA
jgi:hypothetical protein